MAKYSRYDPRNKKRGNHKLQSENKDFRIRETQDMGVKRQLNEVMFDDEHDQDEFSPQQLRE